MRRFRLILSFATIFSQAPFALAVAWAAGRALQPGFAWLLAIIVAFAGAWGLRGRVALLLHDAPISSARRTLERVYYAHWGGSVLALPLAVVLVPAFALTGLSSVGATSFGVYATSLVVALYAVFVRPAWTRVRTLDIPIRGLPEEFDGYRIAQLSDLHVGSLCPTARVRRWVRISNRLEVDAVALTGDYVTSGTKFHVLAAELLSELRAKDGVFAVLGNHDDYGGGEPLRSALVAGGVRLLMNESHIVSRGDAELAIVGVDDTFTRRADVERSFSGLDAGVKVVALAHDPALFPKLAKRGVGLQLSGHTHWGQVALPFFEERVNLAARFYRFHAGLYRDGDSTLYIHPGLGMTGPPLRMGVAPEITILRLKRAAATR